MVEDENYCVTQQVTCLTTDVCQAADPGVVSLIPAQSHTFVEIDHEKNSNVNLFPSADARRVVCSIVVDVRYKIYD